MGCDETVAAVILAAGRSSRMGVSKPLLPLGAASVLERVVRSVAGAGVADLIVVTGHEPEGLEALLRGLPVRTVHNAGYDAGMFSSVKTGVAALPVKTEAFFVLPVDHPLVRPEVFKRLMAERRVAGRGLVHPVCCGRRGHPPLLSVYYRGALLQAGDHEDLGSFLRRCGAGEAEVEVADLTILMDMDTEQDYERIKRFAATIDAGPVGAAPAGAALAESAPVGVALPGPGGPLVPTDEDASYLLSLLDAPEPLVRHCRTVAWVGETLARALQPFVPGLDAGLVRAAGLLHDLARACPRHAVVGQELLSNLGFTRLGEVVGAHMVLPPDQLAAGRVTEEQLVYLADKLVVDERVVSLDERAAATMRRAKSRADAGAGGAGAGDVFASPEAGEGLKARMHAAEVIQQRVEAILGRPLREVLPREKPSST